MVGDLKLSDHILNIVVERNYRRWLDEYLDKWEFLNTEFDMKIFRENFRNFFKNIEEFKNVLSPWIESVNENPLKLKFLNMIVRTNGEHKIFSRLFKVETFSDQLVISSELSVKLYPAEDSSNNLKKLSSDSDPSLLL